VPRAAGEASDFARATSYWAAVQCAIMCVQRSPSRVDARDIPEVAAFQEQHNRNVRRYLKYGPRGALHGDGKADTMRKFAAELVALAPDVILANPLLQATRTVPIVFTIVADPVGAGYVESLARPGGNITGCGDQPQDR
jgi:ABC transporter substrate binding protein